MNEPMPIIVATSLSKHYRAFLAVDQISFQVNEKECFGFLGPNGAGKTSTIRMIQGVSPLSQGELSVFGLEVKQNAARIKGQVGVVPQETNLDEDLSVVENLIVYARYFHIPESEGRKRAMELLDFVQLTDKAKSHVQTLSGGMKRRLLIARALVNKPRLLILDEPTIGLDPQARFLIWEKLKALKRLGVTQVLTTHYMEEAERLCDRLVIMDQGKIVLSGRPKELVASQVGREVLEVEAEDHFIEQIIARFSSRMAHHEQMGRHLYIYTNFGEEILSALRNVGFPYEVSLFRRASLEDVFFKNTGRSLRE